MADAMPMPLLMLSNYAFVVKVPYFDTTPHQISPPRSIHIILIIFAIFIRRCHIRQLFISYFFFYDADAAFFLLSPLYIWCFDAFIDCRYADDIYIVTLCFIMPRHFCFRAPSYYFRCRWCLCRQLRCWFIITLSLDIRFSDISRFRFFFHAWLHFSRAAFAAPLRHFHADMPRDERRMTCSEYRHQHAATLLIRESIGYDDAIYWWYYKTWASHDIRYAAILTASHTLVMVAHWYIFTRWLLIILRLPCHTSLIAAVIGRCCHESNTLRYTSRR